MRAFDCVARFDAPSVHDTELHALCSMLECVADSDRTVALVAHFSQQDDDLVSLLDLALALRLHLESPACVHLAPARVVMSALLHPCDVFVGLLGASDESSSATDSSSASDSLTTSSASENDDDESGVGTDCESGCTGDLHVADSDPENANLIPPSLPGVRRANLNSCHREY